MQFIWKGKSSPRRSTPPQIEGGPSQKVRGPKICSSWHLWARLFHRLMSRGIIPTTLGKGQGFLGVGPLPTFFGLLWLALELAWHLWMCHLTYADVLQWVYNETQGSLEVEFSAILGLMGSNQLCRIINSCIILLMVVYLCPLPSGFSPVPVAFLDWNCLLIVLLSRSLGDDLASRFYWAPL